MLLFPVALGTSLASGVDLTPTRVVAVVLLGAVGTGMAFALNYRMVADIGATRASLVTYVVPVVAVIVGVVVLDEPFGWRLVVGGLLTAAGITLVGRRRAAAPAPAASEASV